MQLKLRDLLELAIEASQVTDAKVGFTYAAIANMLTLHFYSTQGSVVIHLNDDDADAQLDRAIDMLLDLTMEVES